MSVWDNQYYEDEEPEAEPEETPDCHGNGGPECNCARCLAADEKGERMGEEARGK